MITLVHSYQQSRLIKWIQNNLVGRSLLFFTFNCEYQRQIQAEYIYEFDKIYWSEEKILIADLDSLYLDSLIRGSFKPSPIIGFLEKKVNLQQECVLISSSALRPTHPISYYCSLILTLRNNKTKVLKDRTGAYVA